MSVLLASLLKSHRARSGLTQAALSRRIGCDHSYISLIESVRSGMSRQLAESAGRALDLDAYDAAQLLAAAGHWPWPDVPFRAVLAMLSCGNAMDRSAEQEAV